MVMNWNSREQMLLETKARLQPSIFQTHPYFMGRKPYPKQAEMFCTFYSNPKHMLFVGICGMRGGKTRLAADMLCYEAFDLLTTGDVSKKYGLEEDSKFFLTCVASSAEQAEDTIFHEVKKSMAGSPFFQKFNPKLYVNEIRFDDYNIEVKAGISSAMGLVGRTVKANVFDELSKLEKTEGKRSAREVYALLSKSTSSFQFAGKNIVITSPLYTEDKAWELYEENKDSPYACCYNMPTWEMNPNLPFEGEYMQARLAEDPILFWRDFGAIPQSAMDKFFKEEEILRFDRSLPNVLQDDLAWEDFRNAQKTNPVTLVCAGDPSGRMDSFGLALVYKTYDNQYYVAGMKRFEPKRVERDGTNLYKLKPKMEIDPIQIREEILRIRWELGCKYFVFDTWNYPLLQKELELSGAEVLNNVVKTTHYEAVRKLLYAQRLHVPYDPVLEREWKSLIQKSNNRVDHPKGGSKDVADCIANGVFVLDEIDIHPWVPIIIEVF